MEKHAQLKRAVFLCTLILALPPTAWSRIIYVDDDAPGLNDGSSWANAFDHLQDALALARTLQKPVEIRVAQGVYRPGRAVEQVGRKRGIYDFTFDLVEGAVLRGGYAGVLASDPNARDTYKYRTTLSGDLIGDDVPTGFLRNLLGEPTRWDNCDHVVTGEQLTAATVLDGFAIMGGRDAGIPSRPEGRGGPGIRLMSASPTITNCWFHGNYILAGEGGGIFIYSGNPTIAHCLFTGNYASAGGAIATYCGNARVVNCTFYNNWAQSGGAISGRCTVSNCILWGNQPNEVGGDPVHLDITYSDVAGGWQGKGNVDVDPCFANPGYWDPNGTPDDLSDDFWVDGDYHLKSQTGRWDPEGQSWVMDDVTSPCIDAGDPNSPVGEEPEPNGGRINMGAYGGTVEASKSYSGEADLQADIVGGIDPIPFPHR